jgi:hypothetical protein
MIRDRIADTDTMSQGNAKSKETLKPEKNSGLATKAKRAEDRDQSMCKSVMAREKRATAIMVQAMRRKRQQSA